jgi:glycerate kinase
MKIIFAPDSFKGSIRSPEVCEILLRAFQEKLPGAEFCCIPLADGGEGTVAAVLAARPGELREATVHDPLGRPISAQYAFFPESGQAVLEMASASGLELLSAAERNPLLTSTYGSGELIRAAITAGAKDIIMGIGGSATVDGGAGLVQALGAKLLDASGQDLPPGGGMLEHLASVAAGELPALCRGISIKVACDVTNPLLGATGAAAVFGPQKGASPAMVRSLENGLRRWSEKVSAAGLADTSDQPGDGAAGGVGFTLRAFLGGQMCSGARLIADLVGLPGHLQQADWIITGEGCTDEQTCYGKLPAIVAELAAAQGVPCILLSGAVKGSQTLLRQKFTAVFSSLSETGSLEAALSRARENLYDRALAVASLLAPRQV